MTESLERIKNAIKELSEKQREQKLLLRKKHTVDSPSLQHKVAYRAVDITILLNLYHKYRGTRGTHYFDSYGFGWRYRQLLKLYPLEQPETVAV